MYRFKNLIQVLFAFCIFASFSGIGIAQQQSPQPKEVIVFFQPILNNLNIEWQITEQNDDVQGFNIYLKNINKDSLDGKEFSLKVELNNENLNVKEIGKGAYYYNFMQPKYSLPMGFYVLTMESYSKLGTSLLSKETFFVVDNHDIRDYVYFTQYPESFATLNKKYSSKITAESMNGDMNINYELLKSPEGMIIDKTTGLIEFTPTQSGYVNYYVRAFNTENQSEFAEYYGTLYVSSCENPGILKGKITFEESMKIKAGVIYLYQKGDMGILNQSNSIDVGEDGNFELKLDKGDYYAYFMSFDSGEFGGFNLGEWYNGALRFEDAQVISLNCGETKEIEMKVGEQSNYKKFKVSGNVLMEDGTPLAYSTVVFESDYNRKDSLNWGGYSNAVITDENGYYEIVLPDLFKYRAYCYVTKNDKPGNYKPKYWENTFNPMEATLIELTADVENINFVFNEDDFVYPDGSISGKVLNNSNVPIEGAFVIAFMVKSQKEDTFDNLYEGFAAITDENGAYKFDYMQYGEYILFAFPNDMDYAPGFYRKDDVASLTWEDATTFVHDGFIPLKDMNIILPLMEAVQGVGKIEGKVTSAGGGVKNDVSGTELSGASIFLVNESGVTNKYNKSSKDGSYKVTGIAAGKYQFIVDKVGYRSFKEWVEVGEDGVITGHNVSLTPDNSNVSSVDDNLIKNNSSVYPNPASNNIELNINANSNNVKVELYNLLGVKCYSMDYATSIGENSVNINVSELPAGQYLIKIYDGNKISTNKLMINR
jgi:hypothetical protein